MYYLLTVPQYHKETTRFNYLLYLNTAKCNQNIIIMLKIIRDLHLYMELRDWDGI